MLWKKLLLTRVLLLALLVLLSGAACICSGEVGANDARGRSDYGTRCARWDAADEDPWCTVSKGACGESDTFESAPGHWWAHKGCNGKGDPFVPQEDMPKAQAQLTKAGGAGPVGAKFLAGLRAHCKLQTIVSTGGTCAARPAWGHPEQACLTPWTPHSLSQCLSFMRDFKFGAPPESTCKEQLFHAFWGTGTLRDSEWLCIDSFRATQRPCSRLIVWFGKAAALELHVAQHAQALDPSRQPRVEFRLLDVGAVKELAVGSAVSMYSEAQLHEIMEQPRLGMSQWINLVKLLLLLRHGGVWIDLDVLFLRDFAPLLDFSFMESWSAEHFLNNAIVHASAQPVGRRLLELMISDGLEQWETVHKHRNLTLDIFRLPWGGYEMTRACSRHAWCREELVVLPNEAFDALWPTNDRAHGLGAPVLGMRAFEDFTRVHAMDADGQAPVDAVAAFFPGSFAFHHHSSEFLHPPAEGSFAHAFLQRYEQLGVSIH